MASDDDRDTDLFLCDTNTCKFDGECLRIGDIITCICDFKAAVLSEGRELRSALIQFSRLLFDCRGASARGTRKRGKSTRDVLTNLFEFSLNENGLQRVQSTEQTDTK
ncbi:tomoregulin-2a [Tachysurus ichikawai]